jgi:hypothetical protein
MNIKNDIFYVDENMKYLESVIIDYKKIKSKIYYNNSVYAIPEIIVFGTFALLITSLLPDGYEVVNTFFGLLSFTIIGITTYSCFSKFKNINPKDSILSHYLKKHEIYEKSIEDEISKFKIKHNDALKFIYRIYETENLSDILSDINNTNITDNILNKILMKDNYKAIDLADFYQHYYLFSHNENNVISKKIKNKLLEFQDDKSLIEQFKNNKNDTKSFNNFKSINNNLIIKKL